MMGDATPEMVAGETTVATAPPVQPRIAGPLPCVKCLYDLGGLGQDQKCPECGTEVARTLGSPAAAAAADLHGLRRGLLMIAVAMIGGLAWLTTGQVLVLTFAFRGMGGMGTSAAMTLLMAIVPAGGAALVVTSAFGWSRICRAIVQVTPRYASRAGMVKRLAWMYAALFIVGAVAIAALEHLSHESMIIEIGSMLVAVAALAMWSVRTCLGFGLLGDMAKSMNAVGMTRTLRVLLWCAAGLPIIIVASAVGSQMTGLASDLGRYLDYVSGGASLALGLVIFCLGVISILLRKRLAPFAKAAGVRGSSPR